MPLRITLNRGDRIYKYQLRDRIGGGSFGEVWLAHDVTIDRDVATKILDESMAPVAQHLREAQMGNRLDHQNVVKVHYADVVQVGQQRVVLIAMDFHPRGSVTSQVNSLNFVTLPRSIAFLIDILRGLEYLHEQNMFHNDIKPSNILIGPQNEGILTDYGISSQSPGLQPVVPRDVYRLHRAPETATRNQISVQTDIYQVGLTAFRLINGIGLIRELRDRIGDQHFEELKVQGKIPQKRDWKPFVPRQIKIIINKTLNANPLNRYQSALEMRRALERICCPGYWNSDPAGNYLGYYNNYFYTFDTTRTRNGYSFNAFKQNVNTGRRTRINKYSKSRLNESALEAAKKDYMLSVVKGTI